MPIKLHYARTVEGALIQIDDPEVKSREKQIYFCPDPNCTSRVTPKKGEIRQHHFAHKQNQGNCYGFETSLHLLAKDILQELDEIEIPGISLSPNLIFDYFEKEIREIERKYSLFLPKKIYQDQSFNILFKKQPSIFKHRLLNLQEFDIEVEKNLDKIRPDLTLISKENPDKRLHLEIAVTHFVDDLKSDYIKQNNWSLIELDFSEHYHRDRDFTKSAVRKAVLEKWYHAEWINISNHAELIKNRKSYFLNLIEQKIKEIDYAYYEFVEYIFKPNLDLVKKRRDILDYLEMEMLDDELDFISSQNILKNKMMYNFFVTEYRKSEEYRKYLDLLKKENDYWDFLD